MACGKEWADEDWDEFMWGKETKPFLDFEVAPGIELRMHQNLAGTRLHKYCRYDRELVEVFLIQTSNKLGLTPKLIARRRLVSSLSLLFGLMLCSPR